MQLGFQCVWDGVTWPSSVILLKCYTLSMQIGSVAKNGFSVLPLWVKVVVVNHKIVCIWWAVVSNLAAKCITV